MSRLTDLNRTGGGDTRTALMEIEAGVFPIEAQRGDQRSRVWLKIPGCILIADIDETSREFFSVVIHQLSVTNVVPCHFPLLVRV